VLDGVSKERSRFVACEVETAREEALYASDVTIEVVGGVRVVYRDHLWEVNYGWDKGDGGSKGGFAFG